MAVYCTTALIHGLEAKPRLNSRTELHLNPLKAGTPDVRTLAPTSVPVKSGQASGRISNPPVGNVRLARIYENHRVIGQEPVNFQVLVRRYLGEV
jgi:hypothetical protein